MHEALENEGLQHDAVSILQDYSAHGILLFDGVCNFCNDTVNFILDHDSAQYIKFAALQSDAGQALLTHFQLPTSDFDSLVYIENQVLYTKSTAALRIAKHLDGIWSWAQVALVIPCFIRNWAYDLIAQNRYKWFGKQDQCRMPTPAIRARFLN